MTRKDDFIGQLEGYLDEHQGSTPLPDDVRDAVRAQLPLTRQRPTWWPARRFPEMNNVIRLSLAAAAVVAATLLGYNYLVAPNVGGPELGDPAATLSPTPEPVLLPTGQIIDPGTYYVPAGQYTPVRTTFTIPGGWFARDAGAVGKHADQPHELSMDLYEVTHVYADACASAGTLTEVGPTAGDLVAALLAQENIDASGPSAVDLGGYAFQRVDLAIPADLDVATCRHSVLVQIWADQAETTFLALSSGYVVAVYVADVGGERVVVTSGHGPDASADDVAELDRMIASIRLEPGG